MKNNVKRPSIGITGWTLPDRGGQEKMSSNYPRAVAKAGGIPFILPKTTDKDLINQTIQHIDGLILGGGNDIHPYLYNGDVSKGKFLDSERDKFEMLLLELAFQKRMPVFAICRGLQLLNVFMGGSLIGDLEEDYPESCSHLIVDENDELTEEDAKHGLFVEKDSQLFKIINETSIEVNSIHHQGLNDIGDGLKVTSYAPDKLPESVELNEQFWTLGVQWHPEASYHKNDPSSIKLFKSFIEASNDFKNSK